MGLRFRSLIARPLAAAGRGATGSNALGAHLLLLPCAASGYTALDCTSLSAAGLRIPLRDALNLDTPLQPLEAAHPAAAVDMSSIPSKNGSFGVVVGPAADPPDAATLSAGAGVAAGPDASVKAVPAELDRYFFDAPGNSAHQVCHCDASAPYRRSACASHSVFENLPLLKQSRD